MISRHLATINKGQPILASKSAARLAIVQSMGLHVHPIDSSYAEDLPRSLPPHEFVARTAFAKAQAVLAAMESQPEGNPAEMVKSSLIIAADTMIVQHLSKYPNSTHSSEQNQDTELSEGGDQGEQYAIVGKPTTPEHAREILRSLSGKQHHVMSGVAVFAKIMPTAGHFTVNGELQEAFHQTIQDSFRQRFAHGNDSQQATKNGKDISSIQVKIIPNHSLQHDCSDSNSSQIWLQINFTTTTLVTFDQLNDATIDGYVATGEPMGKAGAYGIQGQGGSLVKSIQGCYYNVVGLPVNALANALDWLLTCDEVFQW